MSLLHHRVLQTSNATPTPVARRYTTNLIEVSEVDGFYEVRVESLAHPCTSPLYK